MPSTTPLNIKDPETAATVRRLAAATGESITTATLVAARERLARIERSGQRRPDAVDQVISRGRARMTSDQRSADVIIGYDADGLPV